MPVSTSVSELHVEGKDDLHLFIHLLGRHGITLHETHGPVVLKDAKGNRRLLDMLPRVLTVSFDRVVGFVLDAEDSLSGRWETIRSHLSKIGVDAPIEPTREGFIGEAPSRRLRVGVWIAPDNVAAGGALEDFLRGLVPGDDRLISLAHQATSDAIRAGAAFVSTDELKAVLHCWLAWQKEPGVPFGTAMKALYFKHDSDAAARFVQWFRDLYKI
ncbi:MAG: hypothetical protein HY719_05260 [Planctomycetes bacterium]|nr:hypothetical protein [Planctomycetota bacterium]